MHTAHSAPAPDPERATNFGSDATRRSCWSWDVGGEDGGVEAVDDASSSWSMGLEAEGDAALLLRENTLQK
jgi:hypothetical protein